MKARLWGSMGRDGCCHRGVGQGGRPHGDRRAGDGADGVRRDGLAGGVAAAAVAARGAAGGAAAVAAQAAATMVTAGAGQERTQQQQAKMAEAHRGDSSNPGNARQGGRTQPSLGRAGHGGVPKPLGAGCMTLRWEGRPAIGHPRKRRGSAPVGYRQKYARESSLSKERSAGSEEK